MSSTKKNWGGARTGAGRKPLSEEVTQPYSIRMPVSLVDTCKKNGGAKFVREAVTHYLESQNVREAEHASRYSRLADPNFFSIGGDYIKMPETSMPEIDMRASCGFPSPASDYVKETIDIGSYFVKHESSTFVVTASGDSMIGAGIFDGDKLFVDQSIEPRSGQTVLAYVDGGLTVKTFRLVDGKPELHPENPNYPVIRPQCLDDFFIQGVVVSIGRQLV